MKKFKFSNSSLKNMEGVNEDIQLVFKHAIKDSPIDFGIPSTGGLRTEGCQNELFIQGLSKCDGFDKKSNHQSGNALDFYAYVNGHTSWRPLHLSMVAGVILSTAAKLKRDGVVDINLTWGGTFGSDEFDGWDMPHIEVA